MNKSELHTHATSLRQALIKSDKSAIRTHRDWLIGAVAAALLDQDMDAMRSLRAELASLIAVTDQYYDAGAGERWRALAEILQACADTYKPLEQMRLAQPNRLSGLVLRHIGRESGITPSSLADKLGKQRNHISNELRALEQEGLIHKLSEGRNTYLYISGIGRKMLENYQAAAPVDDYREAPMERNYPHADPNRTRQARLPLSGLINTAA